MASLGIRKFYKAFDDSVNPDKNQIIKNSGYISVLLHSVIYNSKSNFWQDFFGGEDKIALTSSITYKTPGKNIEATSVQDKRSVSAGNTHLLALTKTIALKVPANADGLELKVGIVAVKNDNFENGLNLMDSDEFKQPLELSPIPVGQILSVTKVIKKIFSEDSENNPLEASFAGLISHSPTKNPIEQERLTSGYIIMVANNDEDSDFVSNIDPEKLQVTADGLEYAGKSVTHTNIVYSIIFEPTRGINQLSKWFSKFQEALNKLDDIFESNSEAEQKKILTDSRKLWREGSALLFDDPSYINDERRSIKASFFKKINEKYKELTSKTTEKFLADFLESNTDELDFIPELAKFDAEKIESETELIAGRYLADLDKAHMVFPA